MSQFDPKLAAAGNLQPLGGSVKSASKAATMANPVNSSKVITGVKAFMSTSRKLSGSVGDVVVIAKVFSAIA